MTKIPELFGHFTADQTVDWSKLLKQQPCPYLKRKCLKVRKSRPDIAIGTCSVSYSSLEAPVLICPYRLLERNQIFTDCIHLLTSHEPGNELHILPEISVPGGNVDYFLVSVKGKKVRDFVAIELQTLDTTGTIWPERQRFLRSMRLKVNQSDVDSEKGFGMNWKMTAKTILVQLHHKVQTFEHINKHLALVVQDCLLDYMRKEFKFDHLNKATLGDSTHIHSYSMKKQDNHSFRIELKDRFSTDVLGISKCLGLQAEAKVELQQIIALLEAKLTSETVFTLK